MPIKGGNEAEVRFRRFIFVNDQSKIVNLCLRQKSRHLSASYWNRHGWGFSVNAKTEFPHVRHQ